MEAKNNVSPKDDSAYWSKLAVTAIDDDAAFTEIYNHFFPRIYNFLLSRTKDSGVSDEIVSRTFYKMYQALSSYNPKKAAFSTWLFTIARNELLMYVRTTNRETPELDDEHLSMPDFDTPETKILKKETENSLKAALLKLPERDRKIITMTYWLDMSTADIADALGINPGAVRTALTRARAALRKELEKEEL